MAAVVTTVICILRLVMPVAGNVFLEVQHHASDSPISREEVDQQIRLSASLVLENGPIIAQIADELEPLFSTMPKDEAGRLESGAVRYVLHRYFAQKHGWHVVGLHHAGGAWNSSSPTTILKDELPAYLEQFFLNQVMTTGLGLIDLAVLADIVSGLIQQEAVKELAYIYDAMGVTEQRVPLKIVKRLFKSFLVAKIWGIEEDGEAQENLKYGETQLEKEYLEWPETKMWALDALETFDLTHQSKRNPFHGGLSFDDVVEVAADMNHRHSAFHFLQCRRVKDKLMELEHQGSGRVPLSKFYSGSDQDHWQFVERVDYLRAVGALDESNPKIPSVIIPNYLLSPTNCVGTSSYYSLCCKDDCEDLLAQVEQGVGEPIASPEQIVEIVSAMPSETVHAPRNLTLVSTGRLHDIAGLHGGMVPLHGRLFAQWLHHLFPRECPFPHEAGSTRHISPDDWAWEMDLENVHADAAEMHVHTHVKDALPDHSGDALPWTVVEELVSVHKSGQGAKRGGSLWASIRKVVLMAVVISSAFSLSGWTRAAQSAHSKPVSHLV